MAKAMTTLACVQMLIAAYPKQKVTDRTIKLYIQMLSDLPPQILAAAVTQHISENNWFPTIAELRTLARKMAGEPEHPSAAEAWLEVKSRLGNRSIKPSFSDPLITMALDSTESWYNLNVMPVDEVKYVGIRFRKRYEELLELERDREIVAPQTKQLLQSAHIALPEPETKQ